MSMETKRQRTLKDARAFGLGLGWGLPISKAVRIFIESEYKTVRLDLIGISVLIAILFILTGKDNYNEEIHRDY